MSRGVERLAAEIQALKRQVRTMATAPQLAYSSIEDGRVESYDIDGSLQAMIGKQEDGTQAVLITNGPPPPATSTPIGEGVLGGARLFWDGLFALDVMPPMNMGRVEVHVSPTPAFTHSEATLETTFESPRGGFVYVAVDGSPTTVYVQFVSRTLSGVAGPASAEIAVTTLGAVSDVELDAVEAAVAAAQADATSALAGAAAASAAASAAQTTANGRNRMYVQTAAPTGGTYAVNDLWYDSDNDYQMARWSGSAWVVTQFGNGAIVTLDAAKITTGTLDAARIAADSITAVHIAALTITAAEIAANTITAAKIAASTITAAEIAANTITAAKIAALTITSAEIAANAITATKIDAAAIDGKVITGATVQTSSSPTAARVVLSSIGIRAYPALASSTVIGALNATQGNFEINDITSFVNQTYPITVQVDSEQMTVLGPPWFRWIVVTRGVNGTTAATHASGAAITQVSAQASAFTVDTNGNARASKIVIGGATLEGTMFMGVYGHIVSGLNYSTGDRWTDWGYAEMSFNERNADGSAHRAIVFDPTNGIQLFDAANNLRAHFTTAGRVLLLSTADASLTSTGHALQIGPDNAANLRIDNNEIMAITNGVATPLALQYGISKNANGSLTGSLNVGDLMLFASNRYFRWLTGAGTAAGVVDLPQISGASATYDSAIRLNTAAVQATNRGGDTYIPLNASAFTVTSSVKVKEDIRDLTFAPLAALRAAPSKMWRYKEDHALASAATDIMMGPMAEDLPAELVHLGPSAATENPDVLSTDLTSLVGFLWAALRDLDEEMDEYRVATGKPKPKRKR